MPGGTLSIVTGLSAPMLKVVGNPQFSYFSQVYRRPTNFATEFVKVNFDGNTAISQSSGGTLTVSTLPRYGDLLLNCYFSFVLPDIYSSDTARFQWVKKVGFYLIQEVRVMVSGQVIERFPGEWLDVRSELFLSSDKRVVLDRMTGNSQDVVNPVSLNSTVIVQNNRLNLEPYPVGTRGGTPSISGRRLRVPLPLWFSRTSGSALPLVAMSAMPVQIEVDVRPWSELYQLWDGAKRAFFSPATYKTGQRINTTSLDTNLTDVGLGQFLDPVQGGGAVVDLQAQLECEFGFLDTTERVSVATNAANTMIETCVPARLVGINQGSSTQSLTYSEPTKELVWIVRRSDALLNNEYTNLSNSSPEDGATVCMKEATLLLNNQTRMEAKDAAFFDSLQPLQYHTGAPRRGINVWSFALHPENFAPSGVLDMGGFSSVKLQLVLDQPGSGGVTYQVDVFAVTVNFLNVLGGMAGKQFVT